MGNSNYLSLSKLPKRIGISSPKNLNNKHPVRSPQKNTLPETNSKSPWKLRVGILFSSIFLFGVFKRPFFKGRLELLVSGSVKNSSSVPRIGKTLSSMTWCSKANLHYRRCMSLGFDGDFYFILRPFGALKDRVLQTCCVFFLFVVFPRLFSKTFFPRLFFCSFFFKVFFFKVERFVASFLFGMHNSKKFLCKHNWELMNVM